MLKLTLADGFGFAWAQDMVAALHYLRKPVDPRSRPLAYIVSLAGERVGCLIFGRTQSTACYQGELTYGSAADQAAGKARFDRWEVLNLARVWLYQGVQAGGHLCQPGRVPGFTDRRGLWRPTVASWAIREALTMVGRDYLLAHPPVFVDEPYEIKAVLSYCDTRLHRGTIYRASGFELSRVNKAGIETWWTRAVKPLGVVDDAAVRRRSFESLRNARIRARRMQPTLW